MAISINSNVSSRVDVPQVTQRRSISNDTSLDRHNLLGYQATDRGKQNALSIVDAVKSLFLGPLGLFLGGSSSTFNKIKDAFNSNGIFPDNTILGKLLRGISAGDDIAALLDVLSGNKLAYERALEDRAYQESYNDPSAQVARMLAAGLNPYFNGGNMSPSDAASLDVPSAAGLDGLPSLLFNGLQSAVQSFSNIPEKYLNLKAAREEIKSKQIDNAYREFKLTGDKDLLEKTLRKMDQDWAFNNERREEDRQRFKIYKEENQRAAEEHLKKMITYDDNHQLHLHNVSQWETEDLIRYAQLRAIQLSNDSQEFTNNFINHARYAQIVAQTNSLLRMTSLHENEFKERVRQFDMSYEQAEKWKALDWYQKEEIQNLQEKLLTGQINHIEYTNALERHGLTIGSPSSMKRTAGLAESNGFLNDLGLDFLDMLYSVPRALSPLMP